ncbi:MAG: tRNA preQ1(34) S-adenosylmethionine ribosyltransferase-isomerase QueA [Phycisphaerales bacterium]
MRTDALDFDLPESLIATTPASPRDSSKLLVVSRSDPDRLEDRVFSELPALLETNDLLVFNKSSVIPARFRGVTIETGGGVEGLYIEEAPSHFSAKVGGLYWIVYLKAKRPRVGRVVSLVDDQGQPTDVVLECIEQWPSEGPGAWVVRVDSGGLDTATTLGAVGLTPLPPYIVSQRKARDQRIHDADDRDSYQTMYADPEDTGSIAAPTAGLHFTSRVMQGLDQRGIDRSEVVLHVGAGTFKPVDADDLKDHNMHSERCSLGQAVHRFGEGKPASGRVFAVGSTSARTLESFAARHESGEAIDGMIDTRIMIAPGYNWRWVDGMITNFHLPRSTLIAMVASLLDDGDHESGIKRVQSIYAHAIHNEYRFFSYGDAMLILP